jgi:hypothetical protein
MDQMKSHATPPMYTGYPPYMSARRPKVSKNEETTRLKAAAGQVCEALGMSRLSATVGRMTLKPETENF